MNTIEKILFGIVCVLLIILIIVSTLYIKERKRANNNLNTTLDYAVKIYETNNEISEWKNKIRKIDFHVNIVEEIATAKVDANSEEISIDEIPENIFKIINDSILITPEGFNLEKCYAVYTKKNRISQEYDVLHDYVMEYSKSGKVVKLAISDIEEPVSDIVLNMDGQNSELDGNEFKVYQYGNQYIVRFSKEEKYYDIATLGLTEDMLLDLIESIFKQ